MKIPTIELRAYRIAVLALTLFGAYSLYAKHRPTTLRDVSQDISTAFDHISTAERQIPAGTLVILQLQMAQQSLQAAQQKIAAVAPRCSDENTSK